MGSKLLYYLAILPISYLPYNILYFISDVLCLILYYVIGYRKKVILSNIQNSFPEKSTEEQMEIMRSFYSHFVDIIVESIKGFTITENQIRQRFKVRNPEILDQFFKDEINLIMAGGHYNNWEYFALGIGLHIKHIPVGIYKPLSNKFFGEKMKKTRQRFGLKLLSMKETKEGFKKGFGKPDVIIFAFDQSPSNAKNSYWMRFLNQDTAVLFGVEKYAKEYNRPVIFCTIHKTKRGHYECEFQIMSEDSNNLPYGKITEMNTLQLEKDILEKPEFWLWSHRRWKLKRDISLQNTDFVKN